MTRPALGTLITLCCCLATAPAAAAQRFQHPGGLHTRSEFDAARKAIAAGDKAITEAYGHLMRHVRKNLKRTPAPVVRFSPPGYYSNPKLNRKMHKSLTLDTWAAYSCAVAYRLSANKERSQYADKAVEMLDAWATENRGTGTGEGNLLMSYTGSAFVFAAEAITDYDGWKKPQRERFRAWVRTHYRPICRRIAGGGNNWGDWGTLGSITANYYLDDARGVSADIASLKKKIDRAIAADGRMPAETGRGNNGIWYTYFALAPLTAACRVAQNAKGVNLFRYKGRDGAGIEKALDYLLRYCNRPRTWPHYRGKDLNVPRQKPGCWPGNLFEAMYDIYGKKEYAAWAAPARPIIVRGHHYAWSLPSLLRMAAPAGRQAPGDN